MESATLICPLCNDIVDKLLYRFHLGNEQQVIERIRQTNPDWAENDGACSRCVDYYHTQVVIKQRLLPEVGPYFPVKSADDFVILPTGLRMDADPRFTGKGVTICFIDSGFYLHPDLNTYKKRVKTIIDITDTEKTISYFKKPHEESWHGTMTTVVCAGDGYLSNGLYKGIAYDAELVLLKVQDEENRITTANIVKALQWVLQNHKEYTIRIVNISLGSDEVISYKQSEIDQLAEQLYEEGITVVAAVGNDENGTIKPPANSLHVIAVGGIDDGNDLAGTKRLYHSTFGKTIDELMKPELTAPAIWIAAPILPETKEQKESELFHRLLGLPPNLLLEELEASSYKPELETTVLESTDILVARTNILNRIQSCKYISDHYMHVDGTSFAAPIVCSVIAQLLEVNPGLSPASIREILFSTAKRIDSLAPERQGFGSIQPRKSILKALKRENIAKLHTSPFINTQQNTIEFYVQHDCASIISLSGNFNDWAKDVWLLEPGKNGVWKITIPMLPAGKYLYKFLVDEKLWLEDADNPFREPDGFNGFNSILFITNNHIA